MNDEFSTNLQKLRAEKDLSQAELAKMLGVKRSTVCNYENGYREPQFKTLILLADLLGCSIDELLRGKKNE